MMKWLQGIALVLVIGSSVTVAAEPPALLSTDFNTPESQTCGIQEAIDKLPETGGMVMVPAGLFEMHAPVVMKPNVKLAGAGRGTRLVKCPAIKVDLTADAKAGQAYLEVKDSSQLKPGMGIAVSDSKQMNDIWRSQHIVTRCETNRVYVRYLHGIRDGLATGASVTNGACLMTLFMTICPAADCVISDLEIDGNRDRQMLDETFRYFHASKIGGGIHCINERARVERCWVHDCLRGMTVNGRDTYATIRDCHIFNNIGDGIHVGGGPHTRITGNTIHNNGNADKRHLSCGAGIFFCFGNKGLIITDNYIYENRTGIGPINIGSMDKDEASDTRTLINNNMIYRNDYAAITSNTNGSNEEGPWNVIMCGNMIFNNHQARDGQVFQSFNDLPAAVVLRNARGCVVANNRIFDDQDAYPRKLAEDAPAGATVIHTEGGAPGGGTGVHTLREGSLVRISDQNGFEYQQLLAVKAAEGSKSFALTLGGKLTNAYAAARGGQVNGVKSQGWGILCHWWGGVQRGHLREALNRENLIQGNVVTENVLGGILYSGTNNMVANNIGLTSAIDPNRPFLCSMYPGVEVMTVPENGWRKTAAASLDKNVMRDGLRALKLTGDARQIVSVPAIKTVELKQGGRYRLTGWMLTQARQTNNLVLPRLCLRTAAGQLLALSRQTYEPFMAVTLYNPLLNPAVNPSARNYQLKSNEWVCAMGEVNLAESQAPVTVQVECNLEPAEGNAWVSGVVLDRVESATTSVVAIPPALLP